MIGIIDQVINSYIIIDKIRESFPNISICVYTGNDIEKGIELLTNNKCNMIIVSNVLEISEYQEKYPKIFFLTLKSMEKNGYILSSNELLKYIDQGKEKKIKELLMNQEILEDTIILEYPKLQWIKHLIQEVYSKKNIIDNLDLLIENIKEKENLLKQTDSPLTNIIGERE